MTEAERAFWWGTDENARDCEAWWRNEECGWCGSRGWDNWTFARDETGTATMTCNHCGETFED